MTNASGRALHLRRLAVNISSSYANVALMALITLLVVPLYARTLGRVEWGTVALCMTVQGLLFSFELALGPLMLRDTARAARTGREYAVYLKFLRLYGGFALGACALAVLAMVTPGLSASHGSGTTLAIVFLLLQFAFQFSNNAAIGYWNGLEQQRRANLRLACFALAKHAVALLLVTRWSATALAYLAPFAVIGAIEFLLNFRAVRNQNRALHGQLAAGTSAEPESSGDWRSLAGFGLAAGIGLLSSQIDRIFLSLTLPAAQYGTYYLIGTLALAMLQLQMPIQRAFLPRMATAAAPREVVRAMLKVTLALVTFPCLAMAAFSETVLRLWLHDPAIAASAATPFRLFLLGIALVSLYAPSSLLLISQHRYRTMLRINGVALAIQLLLLFLLTPDLGITAGGLAWLGCGLVQATCAAWLLRHVAALPSTHTEKSA